MTSYKTIRDFLARVYGLVRPYGRKKLGILFLFSFVQGVLQVAGVTSIFPFLALVSDAGKFRQSEAGQVILGLLPEMENGTLLIVTGLFSIAMLIVSNAILLANEVYQARYCNGLGHWMRCNLLTRMTNNPYGFFLQRNSGELLKKINVDVTLFVVGILAPLLFCVAKLFIVILLAATLVVMNPLIAIGAMILISGFYGSVFQLLKKRRRASSNGLKESYRGIMREAQQLMGGIKPIKVHGVESFFLHRFARHSLLEARLKQWIPVYQNGPRYFIEPVLFGGLIAMIIGLIASGYDLQAMLPSLGVMAFAAYRILPNLQLLYSSVTGITVKMHSLEEIAEEFGELSKSPMESLERGTGGAERYRLKDRIDLDDIHFRYPNADRDVIDGATLTIRKNEFIAIVGKTGSGKSSLIDLILSLHTPTAGTLSVDGKPLSPDRRHAWRRGIGYVPQEIFLLDDTIAANIAFGVNENDIDGERLRSVCETAQILSFIEDELPDKWDTEVGERGVRLSGGQRQRIGLARALYNNPSLLIFDEATSALDADTEASLMKAIESLHGQITFIVIAHRLSTIEEADTVIEIENGKLKQVR
jgi:ATP-binding cassette subfamily C protein